MRAEDELAGADLTAGCGIAEEMLGGVEEDQGNEDAEDGEAKSQIGDEETAPGKSRRWTAGEPLTEVIPLFDQ